MLSKISIAVIVLSVVLSGCSHQPALSYRFSISQDYNNKNGIEAGGDLEILVNGVQFFREPTDLSGNERAGVIDMKLFENDLLTLRVHKVKDKPLTIGGVYLNFDNQTMYPLVDVTTDLSAVVSKKQHSFWQKSILVKDAAAKSVDNPDLLKKKLITAFNQGNFEKALAYLESIKKPDDETLLYAGWTYSEMGDTANASMIYNSLVSGKNGSIARLAKDAEAEYHSPRRKKSIDTDSLTMYEKRGWTCKVSSSYINGDTEYPAPIIDNSADTCTIVGYADDDKNGDMYERSFTIDTGAVIPVSVIRVVTDGKDSSPLALPDYWEIAVSQDGRSFSAAAFGNGSPYEEQSVQLASKSIRFIRIKYRVFNNNSSQNSRIYDVEVYGVALAKVL